MIMVNFTFLFWILWIGMTICLEYPEMKVRRLQYLKTVEERGLRILEQHMKKKFGYIERMERDLSKLVLARPAAVAREDYLDNPLTALVMVRRLAEDWTSLVVMFGERHGNILQLSRLGLGNVRWPEYQTTFAASLAVMRSQTTYDINTKLLASGILDGTLVTNISAEDCLYVATILYIYRFYTEAVEWLEEALQKLKLSDNPMYQESMLQFLVTALCYKGDEKRSRATLKELLRKFPLTEIPPYLKNDYDAIKSFNCKNLSMEIENLKDKDMYGGLNKQDTEELSRLCRGERIVESGLRCRYVHYQQPHLRFQPFKLEELQLDPPVLQFMDAITDIEMEELKSEAVLSMEVAGTVSQTGKTIFNNVRTSHHAWVSQWRTKSQYTLTRRIAEMTRLNVWTGESNQLARYGVSGEYLSHWDYLKYSGEPYLQDRIATLMFYLNDVKAGGNTVFLRWNLTVPPVKKSAVLWFNYKRSGELEYGSLHAGCPVLKGTKWVLNRWFRNLGHEFTMPCGLTTEASFKEYYS